MDRTKTAKTAIVVGAGIGGVATAARLAAAGWKVTVVEKNPFTGGRCSLINHDDYRFDQGPILISFPHLFRETFQDLDTSMEDEGVQFSRCNPNFIVYFHDGSRFTISSDLTIMKEEIERFEGKYSFRRYLSFLQEAQKNFELLDTQIVRRNFCSLLSMLRPSLLQRIYMLHPFESLYSRVSTYFWTDRLRRAFTFLSLYIGMSPADMPGIFTSLQYSELAEGSWYPIGGFHKVVDALVNVGKRKGVKYLLNTSVSNIQITHSKLSKSDVATGVILENGKVLQAERIICNADLVYAYNNLLPSTTYARALAKKETSCSTISFYWGLDRQFAKLLVHNIFIPEDYWNNIDTIFKENRTPGDPTFYVNVPSRADSQAAPQGCDSIIVIVPVGHLLEQDTSISNEATQEWDATVSTVRNSVLKTIHARLNISLGAHIVKETVNTPASWKTGFNLDRGAIVGLSHSAANMLYFRPKTKHPTIRGLYFVGASTHPGAGLPITLAGAKIVSEQVLRDALDVQWVPIFHWFYWAIAGLIVPIVFILGAMLGGCD